MKTIRRTFLSLLSLPLLLATDATVRAAGPAGKTQQLASPDQVPEGLAKSDWQSIRAAYEAGRHAFQPIEGGWQARNPGQQWTTRFDRRGFEARPREGNWTWGLELKSYGFGQEQTAIGKSVPSAKADGQRLSYDWDATVQEWWVNDQRGLEHGYTLKERPVHRSNTPPLHHSASPCLFLTLAVRGTLTPKITADAQGVLFHDAAGATVLNYTGLKVWDADGKVLASRFEPAGDMSLRLLVDERGARYPITIDPIAQQAYLKPSAFGTTQAGDGFGRSVAIAGDTVVIGATGEDSTTTGVNSLPDDFDSFYDAGAAYVFVRNGTTWTQQAYLKASNTDASDAFGTSVAVSGDTVVVGAWGEDSSTTGVNSVPNESAADAGAAYVFVRNGATWSQQAYLKPVAIGTTQSFDFFGTSVAVAGDTAVVGAFFEASSTSGVNSTPDEGASGAGAVYVFVRSGTTWTQQAYLKASNTGTNDNFGASVAVSGDTVVAGAYGEDSSTTGVNSMPNESAPTAGAAYVFVRSGTNWTQQAYLKASNTGGGDRFGTSVAAAVNTAVVGANLEDSSTTGVNSTPNESGSNSGAAYVFTRSGTTWTQQAYLKASNTGANDEFGVSVGVSGDKVIVGASLEDSSSLGVNSTPNESAASAGAAYVFARNAATWTHEAYLKPAAVGTTQAGDGFGISVAISGNTQVIGASGEDGNLIGVNSSPNENAGSVGAAYILTLPPVFTGIAPAGGSTTGGTIVTITGENFAVPIAVTLGQASATNVNVVSATTLTATTAANPPGVVNVAVSTLEGIATGPSAFNYVTPPSASLINPPGGPTAGGTALQIYGSGFTGATGGSIAGTPVTSFTVISDSRITATTGPHSPTVPTGIAITKPFLTGTGPATFTYVNVSTATDTDGDGLNDAAELQLGAFGFDLSSAQPTLVNSFLSGLDLYTPAQVQALNVGTPLIQRDGLGQFKLTIGVEKSTTLTPASFNPFPMNGPGTSTVINGAGELEFLFTVPDNAAFFRIEAQ